jgi:hypothetical protein
MDLAIFIHDSLLWGTMHTRCSHLVPTAPHPNGPRCIIAIAKQEPDPTHPGATDFLSNDL